MNITTQSDKSRDGRKWQITLIFADDEFIGFVRKGKDTRSTTFPWQGTVKTTGDDREVCYSDYNGSKAEAIQAVVQSHSRRKHGVELGEALASAAGF